VTDSSPAKRFSANILRASWPNYELFTNIAWTGDQRRQVWQLRLVRAVGALCPCAHHESTTYNERGCQQRVTTETTPELFARAAVSFAVRSGRGGVSTIFALPCLLACREWPDDDLTVYRYKIAPPAGLFSVFIQPYDRHGIISSKAPQDPADRSTGSVAASAAIR
jgi:hypothetical protein